MKSEQDIRERLEQMDSDYDVGAAVSGDHRQIGLKAKITALKWVLDDDA